MQPPKTLEVSVKSQFIKDLSFENFNTLINTEKSQPLDYKININVGHLRANCDERNCQEGSKAVTKWLRRNANGSRYAFTSKG